MFSKMNIPRPAEASANTPRQDPMLKNLSTPAITNAVASPTIIRDPR